MQAYVNYMGIGNASKAATLCQVYWMFTNLRVSMEEKPATVNLFFDIPEA